MTASDHASGSDRVAEVAEKLPEGSVIVNVQGDEPLISPETIDLAVNALLHSPDAQISTTCEPITNVETELLNGNVVKVVAGDLGYALYFSRSPMPFPREASQRWGGDPGRAIRNEPELITLFRKHTGLYVYRREYLLRFTKLPVSSLERIEMLEQLRALEDGARIKVVEAPASSIGVDTEEDLDNVRLKIEFPGISVRRGIDDDIPSVSEVYLRSVAGSYAGILPDEHLRGHSAEQRVEAVHDRKANETYRFLVLEHEMDGVVGSIDYAFPESDNFDHDGRIFSFYLIPEFQRKGLGGFLFRRCLRQMRSEGCSSVCLDTFEANPYRHFYEKMGGKVIGSGNHEVSGREMPTVVYGWDDLSSI